MAKDRTSPYQLKLQALLILYKLAHHRRLQPYDRSWCLRFILAFLYSHANGDRSSFDAFWQAATRPNRPDDGPGSREQGMRGAANRICSAVGEDPKLVQDQFWDELTRETYAKRGEAVTIKK